MHTHRQASTVRIQHAALSPSDERSRAAATDHGQTLRVGCHCSGVLPRQASRATRTIERPAPQRPGEWARRRPRALVPLPGPPQTGVPWTRDGRAPRGASREGKGQAGGMPSSGSRQYLVGLAPSNDSRGGERERERDGIKTQAASSGWPLAAVVPASKEPLATLAAT